MPLDLLGDPESRLIGRRILCFQRVDSSNSVAASHAGDPANEGLVVIAEEQTAGRGRLGRVWVCPAGSGILLSVLLFPADPLRRPAFLNALAAVCVCETIYEHAQVQASIKWPNDVLIRGRKVCGILVEQGQGTVIGIGLNVNTPAEAFAAAQLSQAASLCLFTGRPLDRACLARTLIRKLDSSYAELCQGHHGDLLSRWRWHSGLLGRQVVIHSQGSSLRGRLLDLTFTGILVQETGGEIRKFDSEIINQIAIVR